MRGRKSTLITSLAIVCAVVSLITSFSVLTISNSVQGVSVKSEPEWKLLMDEVSELAFEEHAVEVIKQPSINRYTINYGIRLKKVSSVAQFEFYIKNEGNIDAIVSDIKITGIEEYKDNIDINIFNLKEGDIIEKGSLIRVKVLTNYKIASIDNNVEQIINLDDLRINIKFKEE